MCPKFLCFHMGINNVRRVLLKQDETVMISVCNQCLAVLDFTLSRRSVSAKHAKFYVFPELKSVIIDVIVHDSIKDVIYWPVGKLQCMYLL